MPVLRQKKCNTTNSSDSTSPYGIHFEVRHGDQADATLILTALGVDLAGNKEVLGLRTCAEESKDGWLSVLEDLRGRGVRQVDLIVTDGHDLSYFIKRLSCEAKDWIKRLLGHFNRFFYLTQYIPSIFIALVEPH